MENPNAIQILNNLYGLLQEINLHRPDEEVIQEYEQTGDPQIKKHLDKIKQLQFRSKAQHQRSTFLQAVEQLRQLKEKGFEELKRLLSPQEQLQLNPLFRKFEEVTKEDEVSIIEDQQLLQLLTLLKQRVDENDHG